MAIPKGPDYSTGLIGKIFKKIAKASQRIVVYGSSRTDAGVHAFGQVAHVDLDVNLNNQKIKDALNGNLPWYCRVSEVINAKADFNARFDATSREYFYQCYTGRINSFSVINHGILRNLI